MPDRGKVLRIGEMIVVLPGRNIDDVFIMTLCLCVAFPILLGFAPAPGTLEEVMPQWQVFLWAASLAFGAFIVLLSFLFKDRITGMVIEQIGSVCLASAAFLYSAALFTNEQSMERGAAFSASIIAGFGVTRVIHFIQHQKTLKKVSTVRAMIAEGEV